MDPYELEAKAFLVSDKGEQADAFDVVGDAFEEAGLIDESVHRHEWAYTLRFGPRTTAKISTLSVYDINAHVPIGTIDRDNRIILDQALIHCVNGHTVLILASSKSEAQHLDDQAESICYDWIEDSFRRRPSLLRFESPRTIWRRLHVLSSDEVKRSQPKTDWILLSRGFCYMQDIPFSRKPKRGPQCSRHPLCIETMNWMTSSKR